MKEIPELVKLKKNIAKPLKNLRLRLFGESLLG